MAYLIGGLLALLVLALAVAAAAGKVRAASCCSVGDPRNDARMRAAYDRDR